MALAHQVVGDGPVDLVYLQGYCSHVDLNWESPHLARFLRGLSSQARLIVTDRRGWGCSDRFSPSDVPPLETLTDDLLAVMDAVGSERAVVFATWECGLVASLFAATYPERAWGLILCDAFPTYAATEETPWLPTATDWEKACDEVRADWGSTRYQPLPEQREEDWLARYARSSVAPGALIAETRRFLDTDVRGVFPSIQVPTLVLGLQSGEVGWKLLSPENGRYLAGRIPRATLVELTGADEPAWFHWYGRADAILDTVGRFLATIREEQAFFDRVLLTVLFTDIVGSTEKAAELGDRGWRNLVQHHHSTVRALLARYRGREIDTAGDGFFAGFDGPARAVRCAQAIVEAVRPLGLEVRAGLHTGEVETVDNKVGGIAVNIGARVGALAGASEVLVSQTVKDLVAGSGLAFEGRGEHELKGVPGEWRLYAVKIET